MAEVLAELPAELSSELAERARLAGCATSFCSPTEGALVSGGPVELGGSEAGDLCFYHSHRFYQIALNCPPQTTQPYHEG